LLLINFLHLLMLVSDLPFVYLAPFLTNV
jgi:hypothetical protein